MLFADSSYFEKQSAATDALVVVIKTLTLTGEAESLTRKTCEADIKGRDFLLYLILCYITLDIKIVVKVSRVGFLCWLIPLADENGRYFVVKRTFKTETDAAYASK